MDIVSRRFTAFKVCSWNEILGISLVGQHFYFNGSKLLVFAGCQKDTQTRKRGREDKIVYLPYSLYSRGNPSLLFSICCTHAVLLEITRLRE